PAVDVTSIGAGGGSVAWADPSGVLKVGPRSAGAEPGPACYGHGGEEPTVTDAYVVAGLIDPDEFLGGELRLSRPLAERALADLRAEFVRTVYTEFEETALDNLAGDLAEREREAIAWLEEERAPAAERILIRSADLRYKGQSFEVTTRFPRGGVPGLRELAGL